MLWVLSHIFSISETTWFCNTAVGGCSQDSWHLTLFVYMYIWPGSCYDMQETKTQVKENKITEKRPSLSIYLLYREVLLKPALQIKDYANMIIMDFVKYWLLNAMTFSVCDRMLAHMTCLCSMWCGSVEGDDNLIPVTSRISLKDILDTLTQAFTHRFIC